MGRRSDHSRDELTELALSAAVALAEDEGLAGLTARKVAKAMGYAPGTLYNLFGSLDGLILQVNGQTLDRLSAALTANPSTGQPLGEPLDRLNALLDIYLAFIGRHAKLWHLLFDHRLPAGEPLPQWYRERVAQLLHPLEEALSPLVPDQDPKERREAARLLWASLHGILTLADMGKLDVVSERPAEDMARDLIACFVAGLEIRNRSSTPTGG